MRNESPCSPAVLKARVAALETAFVAFKDLMNERDKRYDQRANAQDAAATAVATAAATAAAAAIGIQARGLGVRDMLGMIAAFAALAIAAAAIYFR